MDTIKIGPVSSRFITYDQAVLYCTFCRHDGYSDWRLPTWAEYCDLDIIGWYEVSSDTINKATKRVVFPVRNTCKK